MISKIFKKKIFQTIKINWLLIWCQYWHQLPPKADGSPLLQEWGETRPHSCNSNFTFRFCRRRAALLVHPTRTTTARATTSTTMMTTTMTAPPLPSARESNLRSSKTWPSPEPARQLLDHRPGRGESQPDLTFGKNMLSPFVAFKWLKKLPTCPRL